MVVRRQKRGTQWRLNFFYAQSNVKIVLFRRSRSDETPGRTFCFFCSRARRGVERQLPVGPINGRAVVLRVANGVRNASLPIATISLFPPDGFDAMPGQVAQHFWPTALRAAHSRFAPVGSAFMVSASDVANADNANIQLSS